MLRMFDLFAVNTAFQPKKVTSNATFIQSVATNPSDANDMGQFIGRSVTSKYHGDWVDGVVSGSTLTDGKRLWTVEFDDSYTLLCGETWLRNHLKSTPSKRKRAERQIDYIFVSNRWRSSVTDAKVMWGPSIHRNKYGKDDHALVKCTWCWKLRSAKANPGTDWSALSAAAPTSTASSAYSCN